MSDQLDRPSLEAIQWLHNKGIFYWEAGGWNIRPLGIEALNLLENHPPPVPALLKQEMILPSTPQQWEMRFLNLIADAKVPAKLEDNRGGVYYANKFSIEGLKVFKAALLRGVDYSVLVKSVMLYYKSSVKYKKAIGNYFIQGDWRTDYEALLASASEGAEALTKHITNEIKPTDGERSSYSDD
jgi:hypothetical protein